MESQFIYSMSSGCWLPNPANKPENYKNTFEVEIVEESWIEKKTKEEDYNHISVGGLISEVNNWKSGSVKEFLNLSDKEAEIVEKKVEKKIEEPNNLQCSNHPTYSGRRLGKNAKQCSQCVKIYEAVKDSGFKETRNRK